MKKTILILLLLLGTGVATQAQMVGSTNRQQGGYYNPGYGQNDAGRSRGALLHFELGLPCAVSLDYQVSPVLMVGAGIGASFLITEYYPVFAQVRLTTSHAARALFLDIKGGYDLNEEDGIILGQVGLLFRKINLGIAIGGGSNFDDGLFCLTISYDLFLNKLLR